MDDDPAWLQSLGPAFEAALRKAQRQGRMTFHELDAALPRGDYTSTRIEDILAYLCRKDIQVIEDDG